MNSKSIQLHIKKALFLFFILLSTTSFSQSTSDSNLHLKALSDTLLENKTATSSFLTTESTQNFESKSQIKPWRVLGVSAVAASSLGAAYIFILEKDWYKDNNNHFHLDPPRNDFHYAHNVDKFGHAFGGYLATNLFSDAFLWAGLSEDASWISGALAGTAIQYGIEYKDGYAPDYGFSLWDPLAGAAGSFYAAAQHFYPSLQGIDFKFSYYRNTNIYQEGSGDPFWNDDYQNQTFWFAFNIDQLFPKTQFFWPAWLALATGVSLSDDRLFGGRPRLPDSEYFIGLDWNLKGIFHPKEAYLKRWVNYLNMVKWPSPTLCVYPERRVQWHWAYPIQF